MNRLSVAGLTLGLILICVSNIPVAWSICKRSSSACEPGYYGDEDGEATECSVKELGDKWPKRGILCFSLMGLACAAATAVITIVHEHGQAALVLSWCISIGWTLSVLQSSVLYIEPSIIRRFALAHGGLWTSIGLFALVMTDNFSRRSHQDTTSIALHIATGSSAVFRALCCLSLPRRPDVYHKGNNVERELTASLWSRLTFGYVTSFLRFAGTNQGNMAVEHFPQLPLQARSGHLLDILQQAHQQGKSLFQAICKAHGQALILQVILALTSALASFGPHVALYGILRGLEDRAVGSPGVWAALLGVTMCVASGLSSWVWWITYSKLSIPIASELLALLYAKSLRRKDIQHAQQSSNGREKPSNSSQEQGQQEVINLVTVDTKRISDYASYNHLVPSSVAQFVVACAWLLILIGWQSLLAGLLAILLISPINVFIAKEYRTFQQTMMQARDKRTSIVHEVVQNIRQIKFSATAPAWKDRVLEARRHELRFLFQACFRETGFVAIWTLTPLLLSAVSLTVYALIYGHLAASVAFTAISIFGSLEVALAALPHLISTALEAKISVDRIDKYICGPDKSSSSTNVKHGIVLRNAAIAWPALEHSESGAFCLSGLDLSFPHKGLGIVTGRTGSGKSLLLSSILGECDVVSGCVEVPSSVQGQWQSLPAGSDDWIIDSTIAYVAQSPWTENGTIRDNILFGLPLDRSRYREVIFASGLARDLEILTDGDQTDIGANGVNLSGGQRLRVSFARALYSRAGILIMDDIFSALDADTSQHVYEHGLTGTLAQGRTRILATHHASLCLPRSDYCVILDGGSTSYAGTVENLRKTDGFAHLLRNESPREDSHSARSHSPSGETIAEEEDGHIGQKFSPEEQRATGSVSFSVYKKLLTGDKSPWMWTLGISASLLYTVSVFGRSWWLRIWTGTDHAKLSHYPNYPLALVNFAAQSVQKVQQVEAPDDLFKYIGVYVGISLAAALMATLQVLFFRIASMRSSQALFKTLLSAVLAAPLRWIDTVPLGRVLNRFTSDVYTVDNVLGTHISELVTSTLQICGVLLASVSVSPAILVLAAVLLATSLKLAVIYLAAAREVKRLESVSRSPILEQFTSSLAGLTTIRAFDQGLKYVHMMFDRIDGYSQVSRHLWLFNWWLQLRISLLGAIFSTATAILVVKFGVSASLAGFAISFVLQYNNAVSTMIRVYASFEMDMNATERVIDYASIETEPQGGLDPPAAWPTQGRVTVDNLVVSYSSELPPALKGLTFTIESNERIGVVGRTGSGKSTLALALFRLMEPSEGQVLIDGLDTSKIKLDALRRAMAIVPQHPTLFAGTVRSNLDPFNWYSQTELIDALERVHLMSTDSKSGSLFLDEAVSEGGANFSQGQRQLLCLARAILQQPKIMLLDEATSAVDMETDAHIQEAIRSEFGRNMSSLLVIAHRLSTIADFDRILVMSEGKIVECGTPQDLIRIEKGVFRELVNQSGEKARVEEIILGSDAAV